MYCTFMLTLASMKMFIRNRAALFFSMFVPLMIMLIFGAMNFDKQSPMEFGLVTHNPNFATKEFLKHLKDAPNLGIHEGTLDDELAQLKAGKRTAILDVPDDLLMPADGQTSQLTTYTNQGRPMDAAMAMNIVSHMADQATIILSNAKPAFSINQQSVSVRNLRYIEFLLPGLVAMSVMQMSVFSVAFVFAQYREKGILKRILATPVLPQQFVAANIITRLCVSLAQAVIFILLGLMIFHIQFHGSWLLLTLTVVMGSLLFLGLGFMISSIAKTMDTVNLLANLLVFPQLFLGNVFFAAGDMPNWLRIIAGKLPLSYFAGAMRSVMTDGASFGQIKWSLLAVLIWTVLLIMAATLIFRQQGREA